MRTYNAAMQQPTSYITVQSCTCSNKN